MKIALLHYSSPPVVGGVESVLAHHARLMSRAGHQISILSGRGEQFDENIPVRVLPRCGSRLPEVLAVKTQLDQGVCAPEFGFLRDQIRDELLRELRGFDVLVAHNVASLHKNLALSAALHDVYRQPGFPRLVLWHHDLAWTTPRYRGELHAGYPWDVLRDGWDSASHVVVSQLRRGELCELLGMAAEDIRVIPNGVDLSAFYNLHPRTLALVEQLGLLRSDPLFLLPVRLTPRKNIELALQVISVLRRRLPQAMLLVTGPEGAHNPANRIYKQKLLDLRDDLDLQGSAHFLAEATPEFLPDEVIADFYRLADALLFPSREEGFGIPIIEAAFSAKPVFCADIPVLRELGGGDVSYFDPDGEPDAIAQQIVDRLDGEVTSRLARRAKHAYTWDSIYALHIQPLLEGIGVWNLF
jgi:glycosyltransferase involved in cell wall biosynthesis